MYWESYRQSVSIYSSLRTFAENTISMMNTNPSKLQPYMDISSDFYAVKYADRIKEGNANKS